MSLPINIQLTYSAENLQAANLLHYKKNYPVRGRLLLWFGILFIWMGFLYVFTYEGNNLPVDVEVLGILLTRVPVQTYLIYSSFIIGIIAIVSHYYGMITIGKRKFKQYKNHVLPIDIEVSENAIRLTADDKTANVKWNEILKATMNENIVLLYISKMSFYIFPKENFKSNEFEIFSALVKEKVSETN